MSAMELIQQLQALPPGERTAFVSLFQQLEAVGPGSQNPVGQPVSWPDIEARHRRILGGRVLTQNAVLSARDEERY